MVATIKSETISRMLAANYVLSVIAQDTQIVRKPGGWFIRWKRHGGEVLERRWSTNGGSHYPPWYRHWGHGGTCTLALSQLIRWIRGQAVLPLSSWHYWCSPGVHLARDNGELVCSALSDAGWPHRVPCVLCGVELERAGDWWDLDGSSGPCCSMRDGCRQQRPVK